MDQLLAFPGRIHGGIKGQVNYSRVTGVHLPQPDPGRNRREAR
jgi:hypothetical protein